MYNSKGFSLIEIMIVVGITAVVIMGMMSMLQFSMLGQNQALGQFAALEMTEDVKVVLDNNTACMNTFGGFALSDDFAGAPTPFNIPEVRDVTNAIRYAIGNTYENGKLTLVEMQVRNFLPVAGPTLGSAELLLVYNLGDQVIGSQQISRDVNVNFEIDGGNNIVNCSTDSVLPGGGPIGSGEIGQAANAALSNTANVGQGWSELIISGSGLHGGAPVPISGHVVLDADTNTYHIGLNAAQGGFGHSGGILSFTRPSGAAFAEQCADGQPSFGICIRGLPGGDIQIRTYYVGPGNGTNVYWITK